MHAATLAPASQLNFDGNVTAHVPNPNVHTYLHAGVAEDAIQQPRARGYGRKHACLSGDRGGCQHGRLEGRQK
eukprot:354232-Chlamydomonas_euryale.AAC.6